MKLRHSVSIALSVSLLVLTPAWAAPRHLLHGYVPAAVASLKPVTDFPGSNRLNLAIGLPLRNQQALTNLLRQIYDPASPNYHHYLTPKEFTEKFGPTENDYQTAIAFAKANGLQVTGTHPNRMLVDVSGSVANIQKAMHVTMHVYRHPMEARTFYAPDAEPSIDLAIPVLSISGLDNYSLPRPRLQTPRLANGQNVSPNVGSGPGGSYIGKDFRAAYVPDSSLNGSGQVVGLLQFDGYTAGDIAYYENQAGLPNITLSNVLIDGASGLPSGGGGEIEVSLDIEMAISMATNLSKVMVYMAPNPSPWEDLLNRMANDNVAKQLSCSWYEPGGAAKPSCDQIFQQMAAQGQSFFSASGDYDAFTGLIPFPGDTPYITEVGGTTLTTTAPGGARVSEAVWNWGNGIGSGGGISTQYPIPIWQTNISMANNQGSTTLRNVPDVALTADNVYVRADGYNYIEAGTSCAAPLWAGFAALVNQQAAAGGRPAVGFINPAISAIAAKSNYTSCFHDITIGNNTSGSSPTKFYAVSGYDLCTGWGTPAGQNLINALANPEALVITPATGFASVGGVGGPFTVTAQSLSLTNVGTNSLSWTLANTSLWLNASPGSGTLASGGPAATVTVSLNTAASNLLVGSYSATLWFTNMNNGVAQGRPFTLSVISPPTITTQPTNQAVLQGATATFNVNATGGLPLFYQWHDNGTNLTDGGNVSGSTSTNLTISSVSAADVGTYTVTVTNIAGSATSSNALLTITPSKPVIILQPSNQTVVAGGMATFTVAAIGSTPLSYQWAFNGSNVVWGTNATLTLTNVQLTQAGNYAVAITNAYGSATSSNATLAVYAVPVITSFSPISGPVGTVVNITGLNFDPTPGNNIVYFGAVKATVTAACVTNLMVTVPPGATYAPITETVNGLVAWANAPFLPTFPSAGTFTNSSLGTRVDLTATHGPGPTVMADIDGDGKPDLVVFGASGGSLISIFRNISTNGTLGVGSFAPRVDLPAGSQNVGGQMAVADVDGDGRLDLVVANYGMNVVSVFQNQSVPGSITTSSFGSRVDLPTASGPNGVAVQDLDGDGKADIIVADSGSSTVSVLRNIGTPGTLTTNSFATVVNITMNFAPTAVALMDIDGDGKPDVVTVNNNSSGAISVLRNLSLVGNITLASPVDFPGLPAGYCLAVRDLDGDGKPDVVMGSQPGGQAVSVYRNLSSPGSITTGSFAPHVDFAGGDWVNGVAIGDLDGDGKPDVAAATQTAGLDVFRNVSTVGSFTSASFAPLINFSTGGGPIGVAIGDLDGDGRPDIAFANAYDNTLSICQNIIPFNGPPVITSQPGNQTVVVGATVAFSVTAGGTLPLNYQWAFNGTNLDWATNATLTLTNVQLSQTGNYAVVVTNVFGSATSSNAVLTVGLAPGITTQPASLTNIVGSTATFTVVANGSAPLSYQWLKNGTNIPGANGTNFILVNVQTNNAGTYSVVVTNTFGSITSSNATLTVLAPPVIILQPANQTVAAGNSATFTVAAIGTTPFFYQWNFNGTNIVWGTNATLTLTNVQLSQAGNYAATITNAYGSATSSNAVLSIYTNTVPVIIAFSPISGPVGTVVNITGLNFDPTPGNNIVYFGAVKATVTAACVTNLMVTVPPGATYAPITETVNGLVAWANAPFLPTFPSAGTFTNSSLGTRVDLTATHGPGPTVMADIDGDGKPDLVVFGASGGSLISIFRNISTNGTLGVGSFAPRVDLPAGSQNVGGQMAVADVDGDGRLDLVVANYGMNVVSVFQNQSVPGSITTSSFGSRVDLPTASGPNGVAVQDLDGDGKADIIVADSGSSTVSVLRNIGTPGTLTTNSFATVVNITMNFAPTAVALMDIDGDGKPDVVTVNNNSSGAISVLRNLSLVGNITLASPVDFPGLPAGYCLAVRDLDGDGKPDVVMGSQPGGQAVSVYRNLSSPGSITTGSFAPHVDFAGGGWVNGVAIGDLDGDGKPDVAAATQTAGLDVFRNVSTVGSFTSASFAPLINFSTGGGPIGVAIGDLDGDGRPDIAFANASVNTLSVYQNVITTRPYIISQPASRTNVVGTIATFTVSVNGTLPLGYHWWKGGLSLNDGGNVSGSTTTTLSLTNVQDNDAGSYTVVVTNVAGSITSSPAILVVLDPPSILLQPTNLTVLRSSNAIFSVLAGGSSPRGYQWRCNGTNIPGMTGTSLILANVQFNQAGNYAVLVTNAAGSILSSNAVLVVNPLFHFVWNHIPSPRFAGAPFTVTIQAQNPANGIATDFTDTVFLLSTNGLPVNPAVSGNFVQGVWTGNITMAQTVTNLVLQAADSFGENGLANPINVVNLPPLTTVSSGGTFYILWPVYPAGFTLETTVELSPANWVPVAATPIKIGDQYMEPIPMSGTNSFYRLRFPGP